MRLPEPASDRRSDARGEGLPPGLSQRPQRARHKPLRSDLRSLSTIVDIPVTEDLRFGSAPNERNRTSPISPTFVRH